MIILKIWCNESNFILLDQFPQKGGDALRDEDFCPEGATMWPHPGE